MEEYFEGLARYLTALVIFFIILLVLFFPEEIKVFYSTNKGFVQKSALIIIVLISFTFMIKIFSKCMGR